MLGGCPFAATATLSASRTGGHSCAYSTSRTPHTLHLTCRVDPQYGHACCLLLLLAAQKAHVGCHDCFSWPCRWLRPYANGALPLMQIRTTLIDLLGIMNLDTGNEYTRLKLENSGLGKIIMFYEKNPLEKSGKLLGWRHASGWTISIWHCKHSSVCMCAIYCRAILALS